MRRLVLLGLFASCGGKAVTLPYVELEAEAVRTEKIDVSSAAGTILDLATQAGDITVEVGDGPAEVVANLRLMARTEAEAERLLAGFAVAGRLEGGVFVVRLDGEAALIEGTQMRVRPLVTLHARVPAGQRVRAASGSGMVDLKGALGDCALVTSFGDIKVIGVRGDVRARTSSGNVRVEDVVGRWIEVDTAFGDVHAERILGGLDVDTGSGDVTVKGFAEGACSLQTGFGDIEATGAFGDLTARTSSGRVDVVVEPGSAVARPWSIQSAFGDVEVRMPQGFDCDVVAETTFGCVTSDLAVSGPGQLTDQRVRGEIGAGGGLLTLRTSSGDIRIRAN